MSAADRPRNCGNCIYSTTLGANIRQCHRHGATVAFNQVCPDHRHFMDRSALIPRKRPPKPEHICPRCRKGWRESTGES